MTSVIAVIKAVIAKTLSPRLQHKLRRAYIVRQATKNRTFHEAEIGALKSFIAPGDSVADIGANVGAYTIELSPLAAGGRVFAFEPVADNYDILQAVIRNARLENVEAYRIALGAKIEKREIVVPKGGDYTGYYTAHFAKLGETGEEVSVSTLDELWRNGVFARLDFIKCDVEGSELEVLQGGVELLRTHTPGLLLEVARATSGDVFAFLKELGYRGFVYSGSFIPTEGYRDKEFSNYLFFHPRSKMWSRLKLERMGA